ncbi:translation initiation factor IF-2, mitochondrial [Aspergillus lentulus]|uniref:Translation initiation factor IF-2, mitochondrial n=1 Tax=Aspergillus lentulus TaxID=293939 RepID=A0ABQ0ZY05_ASPLE|nr:translation initiation factor IF-2, mitochondrial [Aspergillus lentulus]
MVESLHCSPPHLRLRFGRYADARDLVRGKQKSGNAYFIYRLSRRHGPEWSCPARSRKSASAPIPAYVPRRSFRSSLAVLESSSESANPSEDGSVPRPAWGGSKLGGRWGAKQALKPATLSPAEQALRDSLIAKKEAAAKEKGVEKQRRQGLALHEKPDDLVRVLDVSGTRQNSASLRERQPEKKVDVASSRSAKKFRGKDWECPRCQYHCFGRASTCPRCGAPKPKLDAPAPESPRRIKQEQNALKIRRLGQSLHLDYVRSGRRLGELIPKPGGSRNIALDNYLAETGRKTESPPASTESETQSMAEQRLSNARDKVTESSGADRQASGAGRKSSKAEADLWTWDQSALEKLQQTYEAEAQSGQKPKRWEGRKELGDDVDDEEFDPEDDRRRRRQDRKRQKKEKARQKELEAAAPSPLYLPEFISVSNLADVIGVRPAQFVRRMEEMGFEDVSYSHILDAETAGLIASEYNFEPIFETDDQDLVAAPEPEDKSALPPRPPVVTIMGHVDHGKTTILDWLRKSSVAASEHGGITQHIGAFSVAMPSGKTITFLDTPGHAAFLDMRRRGANVTDIVVLVVAADDSVKPQTIEAIKHATESNVPIIVAISKIDKEGINPEKVKQDLSVHGVHVEDYGGDVQAIGVSGKTGQGMLELEEAIVTLSEVLDHRADKAGAVEGWVIEATTKSYGRVATALIRRGTLRPGDIIVAGTTWARVRTLRNEAGVAVSEATPGTPVEIDGWREQPTAGTELLQAEDEQHAKDVVEYRQEKSETLKLSEDTSAINEARREQQEKRRQEENEGAEALADQDASGPKPVHFIIKADVGGSAEAVLNSVTAIGNNEVYANVLRSEVGPISEFDIEHAATASGNIISFNMPIDPAMSRMAELRGVRIMNHNIIYKLMDEVKATLSEHLAPSVTQRVTGEAEVGQIFEITRKGREKVAIAGCKVRNGVIHRARKVRVLRGQDTIYDGTIASLKNVKKDVTEMRKDTECGIGFEGWADFAVGDHIQCYEEIYEKRYL